MTQLYKKSIKKKLETTIKRYAYHRDEEHRKYDIHQAMTIIRDTRFSRNQIDKITSLFENVPKDSNIWNLVKKGLLEYDDIDNDVLLWLKLQ